MTIWECPFKCSARGNRRLKCHRQFIASVSSEWDLLQSQQAYNQPVQAPSRAEDNLKQELVETRTHTQTSKSVNQRLKQDHSEVETYKTPPSKASEQLLQLVIEARKSMRIVADEKYWEEYMTTDVFSRGVTSSFTLKSLDKPLITVFLISFFVCAYQTALSEGNLPHYFPSVTLPDCSPLILTVPGVALLLKVFRANQSYNRWWEAHKSWDKILTTVRSITTQANMYMREGDGASREAIRRWAVAFARCLEAQLQGSSAATDLQTNLLHVLSPNEIDMLATSHHKALTCCRILSTIIAQAPMHALERQQMQQSLKVFYDSMGTCELLYQQPLPQTHCSYLARALVIWLSGTPFALYEGFGWCTILVCMWISWLLLAIDSTGVLLEEPSGTLPLDYICQLAKTESENIEMDSFSARDYVQGLRKQPKLTSSP